MSKKEEKLNVLSAYIPYRKKVGNTDHSYMSNYANLEKVDKKVNVKENTHIISNILHHVGFYVKRAGDKMGVKSELRKSILKRIFVFPSATRDTEVIISRLFYPTFVFCSLPLVWHAGFSTNEYVGVSSVKERLDSVRASISKYMKTEYTIFSTKESISRFYDIAPKEVQNKIVYAPYFLPNVEPVGRRLIEKKFFEFRPIKISFVGSDGIRKGVQNLVRALNIISKEYPNMKKKLEVSIVTKTEVGSCDIDVEKYDHLSHNRVLRLLRNSHVFCMPTLRDSYGLVYVEAMASGCAVVADDSPVREEILDGGDAGLLSNPHDPDDIADKLITLIHSPEYAKKLAMRARDRFQRRYHWKPVGEKYVDLLRRASSN